MSPFENKKLTILYGSQTGNAQDVAERIWRESKRYFFGGSVCSLDDYDVRQLVYEEHAIVVCATTGQGEEPDNMKRFWRFLLRKQLSPSCLQNLRYAVLGLGDSSYVKYNFVAKRLNRRLAQLGADALIPLGLADDQHDLGYDAATDPWIELLWSKLLAIYPLPLGVAPLSRHTVITPKYHVFAANYSSKDDVLKDNEYIYDSCRRSDEFLATVSENIRTTNEDHFQDVRLIKLKTGGQSYNVGDVVAMRPRNLPEQVAYFQRVLTDNEVPIKPNTILTISERTPEMPVPAHLRNPVSFQQLCEEYFDLTAIPRRNAFAILAQITDSELERDKCEEFATAEGQEDLYNYCNRPRRNIVEVLEDFPHATKQLRADTLFELLPVIKPREFSIASNCHVHRDEVHILVAVVKYRTKLVKERLGLCSNYLADLNIGDPIYVWFKKGSFKFPVTCDNPVIMIGPGTGFAPFRNYIYDQVHRGSATADKLVLFFGCRGKNTDFHCRDELMQLQADKKLRLICAFSRDQEDKEYVQHQIVKYKEQLWPLLKHGKAQIFVAGNSKNMPQGVRDAFLEVLEECGSMTSTEAEEFLIDMEKRNHYQTETWC